MKNKTLVLLMLAVISAMLIAGCTQPKPAQLPATPVATPLATLAAVLKYPGCPITTNDDFNQREEMVFNDLRGYRFAEVFLTCEKTSPCYNTVGLNYEGDPKDSFPDSLLANFSEADVAAQWHVPSAWLNGPKIWMFDTMVIGTGVQVRDFDGTKARWVAYSEEVASSQPYVPFQIERTSTMIWNAGKPEYILDDPSGTPYILKSYNPKYVSESDLNTLDKKLKLPQGWKFRVVTLKEDLIEIPVTGTAWIMQDELNGVWDKATPPDMNYTP